jgi:hypothetical protein
VTRTTKLIVAVAAVAAVVAAYWMLVLAPKREEITKLDADIATKQQELEAAKATLATYRKDREGYARNYSTLVRLGKAVPEHDDTRSLLVQLEDAADRSGVDFRTLSVGGGAAGTSAASGAATGGPTIPGATVGTAGFSVMPLTFSFRGSFFNMSQFFSRLEHFVTVRNSQIDVTGRLMRVESISLKPDSLGFPSLRAEIGASTYLLPESEGSTAGATQAGPSGTPAAATPAEGGTPPTTTATVPGVTP